MSSKRYTDRFRRLWLAARVGVWLCALPLRLRRRGVTALLTGLTPTRLRGDVGSVEVEQAVPTVLRVCALRVSSTRFFPRTCLREALTLYHVLRDMGYPAEFHIGVRKDGHALAAHSWVTLRGAPIVPHSADPRFRTLYSYPSIRAMEEQL